MNPKRLLFFLALTCASTIFAQDYELVWSDEFDYQGFPDSSKWSYDVGGNGWGNHELQYYTKERSKNARVEDGKLIIQTHKEDFEKNKYTSARLVTKDKGDWLYGRFEVRAKLPAGKGTWAAIWMLPTDWAYGGWPKSGEIDIMEHVGYDMNKVHGTVHTESYNHIKHTEKGKFTIADSVDNQFHVYSCEWTENKVEIFVDSVKYFEFEKHGTSNEYPFDKRFHLILNIAIGGFWGGVKGIDDTIFPQQMEVDYVRVYQKK